MPNSPFSIVIKALLQFILHLKKWILSSPFSNTFDIQVDFKCKFVVFSCNSKVFSSQIIYRMWILNFLFSIKINNNIWTVVNVVGEEDTGCSGRSWIPAPEGSSWPPHVPIYCCIHVDFRTGLLTGVYSHYYSNITCSLSISRIKVMDTYDIKEKSHDILYNWNTSHFL